MLKLEMLLLVYTKCSPSGTLNIRVRLKYFKLPSINLKYPYTETYDVSTS